MHINKGNALFARESKGNAHGTQGERSSGDNFNEYLLLDSDEEQNQREKEPAS